MSEFPWEGRAVEFRIDLQTTDEVQASNDGDKIAAAIAGVLRDLGRGEIVYTEEYTF